MIKRAAALLCLSIFSWNTFAAVPNSISQTINKFIANENVTAMSVGINNRQQSYIIQHGEQIRYPINSMSKTFTTLALAYAANNNELKLSDRLEKFFPGVHNKPIGGATLINLATHTSGLPLNIQQPLGSDAEVLRYLQQWRPAHPIGTFRIYSNLGMGLLGKILQQATHQSYAKLIRSIIIVPQDMAQTQINPVDFRYFNADSVFIASDGIISSAKDMNTFLRMMMLEGKLSALMRKSVDTVLTDYYKTPYYIDDFGWQKYNWPISLRDYLRSSAMKTLSTKAVPIKYHKKSERNELLLKTGAGHGYTSIMAFLPQQKNSVVILIHKNTSMRARMKLAYEILHDLK